VRRQSEETERGGGNRKESGERNEQREREREERERRRERRGEC
jgi:hypothetical protein